MGASRLSRRSYSTGRTGSCPWWEERAVAKVQPRQCRYERRRPPQQKARSNSGNADPATPGPRVCSTVSPTQRVFGGERTGEHRLATMDSDLLEGKKPAGCVVQCTCGMWAFFGVAWLEPGRLWWLLVDRTNTETIAKEPKHAPTYTAQRRLNWQVRPYVGMPDRPRLQGRGLGDKLGRHNQPTSTSSSDVAASGTCTVQYQGNSTAQYITVCLSVCAPGEHRHCCRNGLAPLAVIELAQREGQSKRQVQGSPNKPLAGVAALAPAYISLVAFRTERQLSSASGQVGGILL